MGASLGEPVYCPTQALLKRLFGSRGPALAVSAPMPTSMANGPGSPPGRPGSPGSSDLESLLGNQDNLQPIGNARSLVTESAWRQRLPVILSRSARSPVLPESSDVASLLEDDVRAPFMMSPWRLPAAVSALTMIALVALTGVRGSSAFAPFAPKWGIEKAAEMAHDAGGAFRDASARGLFDNDVCGDMKPGILTHVVEAAGKSTSNNPTAP